MQFQQVVWDTETNKQACMYYMCAVLCPVPTYNSTSLHPQTKVEVEMGTGYEADVQW